MFTFVDLVLKNTGDVIMADRGALSPKQVRMAAVHALVDTGSGTLVIPERLATQLGLTIKYLKPATVAGGGKITCKVTEPISVYWEDREATCEALIMPGEEQVLLGAIPLEAMDLTVNPARQRVEGAHGDEWVFIVK